MSREVIAVLDADATAIAAPHIERFNRAVAEQQEAARVLRLAVDRLYPGLLVDGVTFDGERREIVRLTQEVDNGVS